MTDKTDTRQPEPADSKAWTPKSGDFIEGTILHIGMAGKVKVEDDPEAYGRYPMIDFAVSSGTKNGVAYEPGAEVVVHAFHKTLANALKDMRIQPGEDIRIRYDGQLPTVNKHGNNTHIYHVRPVNPREFNWANVEG